MKLVKTIIISVILFVSYPWLTKAVEVEYEIAPYEDYIHLIWNKPLKNQTFIKGGDIEFEGEINFYAPPYFGFFEPYFNDPSVTFYITNSVTTTPFKYFYDESRQLAILSLTYDDTIKEKLLKSGNWIKLGGKILYGGPRNMNSHYHYYAKFKLPNNVPLGDVYARIEIKTNLQGTRLYTLPNGDRYTIFAPYRLVIYEKIKIIPPPPPYVDLKINGSDGPLKISEPSKLEFTAIPSRYKLELPATYTISWTSLNASSCIASSNSDTDWSGEKTTSGSQDFQKMLPADEDYTFTYTIQCWNPLTPNFVARDSVKVIIPKANIAKIEIDPSDMRGWKYPSLYGLYPGYSMYYYARSDFSRCINPRLTVGKNYDDEYGLYTKVGCDPVPQTESCTCKVSLSNGEFRLVKFVYKPLNKLIVQSQPIKGVPVMGTSTNTLIKNYTYGYYDKTDFTRYFFRNIADWLLAPLYFTTSSKTYTFNYWEGCDNRRGLNTSDCLVEMSNGSRKTVTAHYVEITNPYNSLTVTSFPQTGIPISASNPAYSGTTTYIVTSTSNISTTLTAPLNFKNYIFDFWKNCDKTTSTKCDIKVTNNQSKEVTAYYKVNRNTLNVKAKFIGDDSDLAIDIESYVGNSYSTFYSGTTEYTRYPDPNSLITLKAPTTSIKLVNSFTNQAIKLYFDHWDECDSVNFNLCTVQFGSQGGETKKVTAYYRLDERVWVDLKVSWKENNLSFTSDGPVRFSVPAYYSLIWQSQNVTTCFASGNWSGNKATSGMVGFLFIGQGIYHYNISCSGPKGTATDSVCVAVNRSVSECTSITPTPNFDLSVKSLDIRSFICKNKSFDQSFWNENSSTYASYAPSTTYATNFYNEAASSTCPESQVNRPVEFSATATCSGNCAQAQAQAKLQIKIEPEDPRNHGIPSPHNSTNPKYETYVTSTSYNTNYPKSIKGIYIFKNAYDYKVTACVVDSSGGRINDQDTNNNCKEWSSNSHDPNTKRPLRIFDYICWYGFSAQTQRDWNNPPLYLKILKIFGTTDSPTRYWRNEICRAQIGS